MRRKDCDATLTLTFSQHSSIGICGVYCLNSVFNAIVRVDFKRSFMA